MNPDGHKKRVAAALLRLGIHTRAKVVVQALAEQGVRVEEALVTLVRLELLKKNTPPSGLPPRPRMKTPVRRCPQGYPRRSTCH